MLLMLVRAVFVFVVAGLGVRTARIVGEHQLANPYVLFIGVMLAAVVMVVADLLTPRKRIQTISAIYFGVIVGIFLTNLVTEALQPTMELYMDPRVHMMFSSFMMIFICYRLHLDAAPDQGRFSLHHPVHGVLQGGQGGADRWCSTPRS